MHATAEVDCMDFRVTLVQMPCVEGKPDENHARARWLLEEHKPVADREFIVLPELFAMGFRYDDYRTIGPDVPGSTTEFLESLAQEHGAYVAASGVEAAGTKFYNALVVASPDGRTLAKYRKIHPFQSERDVFRGGPSVVLFEAKGMKVGVEICYDIRFPELTRRLALEGAELVLVPGAFPDPRSAHWDTLVMSRAIENQLYVAACNRIGFGFDGKTYFGHSQVVDPWGVRLTRINTEERAVTTTGDTTSIESVRSQITCFADRVESAYGKVEWFRE